jgi:putative NIF3 family GTP cyclohydrolase 1 type 2
MTETADVALATKINLAVDALNATLREAAAAGLHVELVSTSFRSVLSLAMHEHYTVIVERRCRIGIAQGGQGQ